MIEFVFRHWVSIQYRGDVLARQTEKAPDVGPRQAIIEMREREAPSGRLLQVKPVRQTLVEDGPAIHQADHRVVPIAQAPADLLDVVHVVKPLGRILCLGQWVPFERTVDVLEPDVVSRLTARPDPSDAHGARQRAGARLFAEINLEPPSQLPIPKDPQRGQPPVAFQDDVVVAEDDERLIVEPPGTENRLDHLIKIHEIEEILQYVVLARKLLIRCARILQVQSKSVYRLELVDCRCLSDITHDRSPPPCRSRRLGPCNVPRTGIVRGSGGRFQADASGFG